MIYRALDSPGALWLSSGFLVDLERGAGGHTMNEERVETLERQQATPGSLALD